MDAKEKEFYQEGHRLYKKIGKSIVSTLIVFLVFIMGLNALLSSVASDLADTWLILSCFLGIIFTIFYCSYTILEAIKIMNHKKE